MYITIKNNLISVYSLKKEIGIDDINVYFNGKQLEDNRTLFEYNIKKNDRVEVVKKNRGGRLTGGQIFGYVILLFVYMGILLSGLIPFISFIMSNIIIKSLVIGVDFVKGLLDENNWLHSFMDFVKESVGGMEYDPDTKDKLVGSLEKLYKIVVEKDQEVRI